MTIGDLINQLNKFPLDTPVVFAASIDSHRSTSLAEGIEDIDIEVYEDGYSYDDENDGESPIFVSDSYTVCLKVSGDETMSQ